MKLRNYISLLFFLIVLNLQAQIGIGTTSPNASSMLDITSTNSGLLIPRIALINTTDVATIASPVTSLLVYNTGFSPNGYYYWNGSIWVQLSTGTNSDWTLTGNTGTSATTNFFGTTDDVDIVFKRNNIRAGFIGNPTIASGNKNTTFGANTLNSITTGSRNAILGTNIMPSNTTGSINVAIGEQTMYTNTIGNENVAVGVGSLYLNLSGSFNTAIGRNALTANSTGASNTALGYASLLSNTNSFNTAVGRDAMRLTTSGTENTASGVNSLYSNLSGNGNAAFGVKSLRNSGGNYNVGIGYESFFLNSTGNYNVGIGYQAGYNETGSNRLYIENTNADASNALIYGEFDNNIVRANGTLQIGNPATTGYAFPTSRGTVNQVLQTNGAGATTWVAPSSLSITETDPKVASTTTNAVPKWSGTALVDGVIVDNGTNVGIGVTPSVGNKLEINGKTKTTNFQMTNGAVANYFLQSDATGNASWASIPVNTVLPYTTTGSNTGIYYAALTEYTIRVFNGISEIRLPNAVGNSGKIYIIIGSNGISSKTFSTSGGIIYDDVSSSSISVINPNERYTVQSDGSDWIVIGR